MSIEMPVFSRIATIVSGVCLLILFIGCSQSLHPELENADVALTKLEADPEVREFAPRELNDAQETVAKAKSEWFEDTDEAQAEHMAYVVGRRIEIANLSAKERKISEQISSLDEVKDDIKLASERARAQNYRRHALVAERKAESFKRAAKERSEEVAKLNQELDELKAKETERGMQLVLGDVLFELDRAALKPGAKRMLKPVADYLRNHPEQTATIEGHTDSSGSSEYNLQLSKSRANAVKDVLTSLNVEPSRIDARGLGEQYPRASNDSSVGKQENRRVEIFLSPQDQRS